MTTEFKIPKMKPFTPPGARLLMRLFTRFEMIGRDNFPTPPYIVVSNHMSYFDGVAACAIITQSTPALAAKKYQGTLMGFIIKAFTAPVWIEQESPDMQAIKNALAVIKAGVPLAIAPEGTRSKTQTLKEALEGAAYLIHKARVPVVPMGISGTDHILKEWRPRVQVRIGKPFRLQDIKRPTKEMLKEDTIRLMCSIAALIPERYHGFYAGHAMIEEMKSIVL